MNADQTSSFTKFPVRLEILVRFADVDLLGHVNNAKYFTYMEEARIAYLKRVPELNFIGSAACPPKSVVLASIACDFLDPVRIGTVLMVEIGVTKIGRKSLPMEYRMSEKQSGKLVAKGTSTLVAYDFTQNKSIELSPEIRKRISEIENEA
jgi:acyl-CoA thioester hydrolase